MSSSVQSPFVAPYVQPLGKVEEIRYTESLRTIDMESCHPSEFEREAMAAGKSTLKGNALGNGAYEMLPDVGPIKIYLDSDRKYTDGSEVNLATAAGIRALDDAYLTAYLTEKTGVVPIIKDSEAHRQGKYSYHKYVQNILMTKEDQNRMVRDLNAFVAADQARPGYSAITESSDKYGDYVDNPKEAFDESPYHATKQKFRCVGANKPGERNPFKLIEGHSTFNDTIIGAFFAPDAVVYSPPKPPAAAPREPSAAPASDADREMNKKFVEMCLAAGMFCVAARDFKTWCDMGLFLKGYFGDNDGAYALFDEFSKLAGAGHYTPADNRDKWDKLSANPDKYDNFGTFVNWAKKDNAAKYKEITGEIATLKKNAKAAAKASAGPKLKLADADAETAGHYRQYLPFDITTDIGAMKFLTEAHPNKFMWIRDKEAKNGDLYSWTGTRWEVGTLEFQRFISTTGIQMVQDIKARVQKELAEDNQVRGMLLITIGAAIMNFQNHTGQLKIIASSEAFFTRDIQFDANVDIIGFDNGIYDLVKHEFRPTEYYDYITMSCGYDYNTNVDPAKMAEVQALLDTIIPNPENRQLLLEVMSAGLTGRAIEKFVLFNGGGRNGKGLLDEFLKTIFGDYQLIYANVSLLTEKDKTGGNPEKASLHNKRIVIMKEPDGNEPLRNDRVKDITGGGNVSGRMLYSNKTIVNLNLILIMECNDRPKFKTEPTHAEDERVIDILFPNRFSTLDDEIDNVSVFKANGDYKTDEWKNAHRDEFLQIIIQAFKAFQSRDYAFAIPQNVKDRTRAYLNASFPILEIFSELYTKTGARTDVVKLKDIYDTVKGSETFLEFDKKEKRMYNYKYFCEFVEKNRELKGDYHDRHRVGAEQYKNVLVGYVLTSDLEEAEEG